METCNSLPDKHQPPSTGNLNCRQTGKVIVAIHPEGSRPRGRRSRPGFVPGVSQAPAGRYGIQEATGRRNGLVRTRVRTRSKLLSRPRFPGRPRASPARPSSPSCSSNSRPSTGCRGRPEMRPSASRPPCCTPGSFWAVGIAKAKSRFNYSRQVSDIWRLISSIASVRPRCAASGSASNRGSLGG